jgi:hypothetical protein
LATGIDFQIEFRPFSLSPEWRAPETLPIFIWELVAGPGAAEYFTGSFYFTRCEFHIARKPKTEFLSELFGLLDYGRLANKNGILISF